MNILKEFGKRFLKFTLVVLAVFLYLTILIGVAFFTDNQALISLWVGFVIFATMWGAIAHAIANEKEKTIPYLKRVQMSFREATKKFFLGIAILVVIIMVGLWMEEDEEPVYTPPATLPSTYYAPSYVPAPAYSDTVHYDSDYEYNYRTGSSGSYDYNYDVEGYSDSGDYFYGNVDTSGKYGDGYIYDEDGNEMYVETEWVDYGVMEATDEDGNSYEFEVD